MSNWNLHRVEEAFAAAAVDPSRWVEALDCAAEETDSTGALLLPVVGDPLPTVPVSESLAKAHESYFQDGWHRQDQRFRGVATMRQQGVADDLDCVSPGEMQRHPFYQEFLAPRGLRWFAGVEMRAGDDVWCLSINRSIDRGPFSAAEKRRLARLSRKLASVAELSRALGFASASATLEAFDVSGTAAVLLDRQAKVIRTNAAAERLLLAGSVRMLGKRIAAADPAAGAVLCPILRDLLWNSSGASLMPPVALPRPMLPPVLAYTLRLPTLAANPLGAAQAVVVLIDPRAKPLTVEDNLRQAFHLTKAEARLASRLATGEPLEQICDQIGIVKETGRNQLKSIFTKTGVNRQAELVLLMARML